MAMSGTGMMMGIAAGQALIQMLTGGSGAAARGMMGGMGGRGGMMGGSGQPGFLDSGLDMMKQASQGFAKAGGKLRELVRPMGPEPFALVSRQPGRRRYRASFAKELEGTLARLSSLPFLKEVRASALTGSILFVYEANEANEEEMDRLATALRERVFRCSLPPAPPRKMGEGLPSEAHAGAVTRSLRGTVRSFSAWLKEHTGGWLDISSAASLFFFLRGFQKMFERQQFPTGSQMFWWAVSLMRGWRTV